MRTWLAFAAIGAGIIHLALVISSPLPVALALLAVGALETAWGALVLARGRIARPRAVLFSALLPVLGWAILVTLSTVFVRPDLASPLGFIPMGIASVLDLAVALALAIALRRGADPAAHGRELPAGRYLLGLLAGALLVGTLTTPALASTQAGQHAHHHGGPAFVLDDPHAGH